MSYKILFMGTPEFSVPALRALNLKYEGCYNGIPVYPALYKEETIRPGVRPKVFWVSR